MDITNEAVIQSIADFKPNKYPVVDGISSTYVLNIKDCLALLLALLFQKSLDEN